MTELLECVINQIKKLPVEDKDAYRKADHCVIASRLMEELEDDLAWNDRFSKTTDKQWAMIVDQVHQEINFNSVF